MPQCPPDGRQLPHHRQPHQHLAAAQRGRAALHHLLSTAQEAATAARFLEVAGVGLPRSRAAAHLALRTMWHTQQTKPTKSNAAGMAHLELESVLCPRQLAQQRQGDGAPDVHPAVHIIIGDAAAVGGRGAKGGCELGLAYRLQAASSNRVRCSSRQQLCLAPAAARLPCLLLARARQSSVSSGATSAPQRDGQRLLAPERQAGQRLQEPADGAARAALVLQPHAAARHKSGLVAQAGACGGRPAGQRRVRQVPGGCVSGAGRWVPGRRPREPRCSPRTHPFR